LKPSNTRVLRERAAFLMGLGKRGEKEKERTNQGRRRGPVGDRGDECPDKKQKKKN